MRPRLSCKKLLATALMHTNNCITQNNPFHTLSSGWSIDRYTTKIVEATYKSMPYKVYCCLVSSSRSFCMSDNIRRLFFIGTFAAAWLVGLFFAYQNLSFLAGFAI